jgi:hypothetical protein
MQDTEYYILSARNGKEHFVQDRLDWFAQDTICGQFVRGTTTEKKYTKSVSCKKCMTKAGYIKKEETVGPESSAGVIGYRVTMYRVLKEFDNNKVGDIVEGDTYNREREG